MARRTEYITPVLKSILFAFIFIINFKILLALTIQGASIWVVNTHAYKSRLDLFILWTFNGSLGQN